MRSLLSLSVLLVLGHAAHADTALSGRFRMKISDEAMRTARLFGKPAPYGRLVLLSEGKFDLQADGGVRHGIFKAIEDKLTLVADDGTELHGERKGTALTVEGFAFEPEVSDFAGVWTVHQNGIEQKGLKMDLKTNGTFRFSMAGATSEGTWSVEGEKLVLVWTKIDNEKVDEGTVRKEVPIATDGLSFQIDTYRYERSVATP